MYRWVVWAEKVPHCWNGRAANRSWRDESREKRRLVLSCVAAPVWPPSCSWLRKLPWWNWPLGSFRTDARGRFGDGFSLKTTVNESGDSRLGHHGVSSIRRHHHDGDTATPTAPADEGRRFKDLPRQYNCSYGLWDTKGFSDPEMLTSSSVSGASTDGTELTGSVKERCQAGDDSTLLSNNTPDTGMGITTLGRTNDASTRNGEDRDNLVQ